MHIFTLIISENYENKILTFLHSKNMEEVKINTFYVRKYNFNCMIVIETFDTKWNCSLFAPS